MTTDIASGNSSDFAIEKTAIALTLVQAATWGGPSVGSMFDAAASLYSDRLAIADKQRRLTYCELRDRVNSISVALQRAGVQQGNVVAILSENRTEYVEVQLACAKLGAMVACQNWRQSTEELTHSLSLVESKVLFVSPRYTAIAQSLKVSVELKLEFGTQFEEWIAPTAGEPLAGQNIDPESGLLILYTSGTTGLPKGAVISHRAIIARSLVMMAEWSVLKTDGSIAWSPLFHMAASDPMYCALMQGAPVILVDGFDANAICTALEEIPVGWFVLLPGMIERMIEALKANRTKVRRVAVAGCMANLVPLEQIAEVSALLNAPFLNSFGSTEAGIVPASGSQLSVGEIPSSLRKKPTFFADVRVVDDNGAVVAPGEIGEICVRSMTLFSGYLKAPEATANDFRNGWFHTGDDFILHADGTMDFVDRRKYLIKSGGENIYPAEIERLVLTSERVKEAVVVRQPHAKWGEVPVLFVVRQDELLDEEAVIALIAGRIAHYKMPKRIIFAPDTWIERNVTGKIRRDLLENRLLQDASLKEMS